MRSLMLVTIGLLLPACGWSEAAKRMEGYAHRGARSFAPENTMAGYQTALRIGADWLDMDVVLTREHEILLSHDLVLNPDTTRNEQGGFLAPSREALQKLPLAERDAYDRKYATR